MSEKVKVAKSDENPKAENPMPASLPALRNAAAIEADAAYFRQTGQLRQQTLVESAAAIEADAAYFRQTGQLRQPQRPAKNEDWKTQAKLPPQGEATLDMAMAILSQKHKKRTNQSSQVS